MLWFLFLTQECVPNQFSGVGYSRQPPRFPASDSPISIPTYPYSCENIGGWKTLAMVIF